MSDFILKLVDLAWNYPSAKVQESRHSVQRQDTFAILFDYKPYFQELGFKETWHAGSSVAQVKRFHFQKRLANLDYKVWLKQ